MVRKSLSGLLAATVIFFGVSSELAAQNINPQEMDQSVKAGDDFYRYANGGWLRTANIPAGQSSFDTRAILNERNNRRVRDLVQGAAASTHEKGSLAQKVGDYYASFMDRDGIETKGIAALSGEMARIGAINNKADLSSYLGTTLNSEVDGLTANSDHIFGLWINQGFLDADHNLPHIMQGGLGIADRDTYLDPSTKMMAVRADYQAHIATILKLAGASDPASRAAGVLALEIHLEKTHAPDSDAADVFKQNNTWKRTEFESKAPGMNWNAYFAAAGLQDQAEFIVWQPSAVIGSSALVESESVEIWKDYLRFHLVEHYSNVLPKVVSEEDFAFFGKQLTGAQEIPERTKLALAATNGALGQAVGQLYTQAYFGPEAKAKAETMARNLIAAYRSRISNLAWMSAGTKKKALAKLDAFKIALGYPDVWIDYSALEILRNDAFGNMRRAEAFNRIRNLAQLKKPVEPVDWPLNPQVQGAVIMFSPNMEFFSAGILQPPYFDSKGDDASNYGSSGAGMAHEIGHSFDELGNIYDDRGRLGMWWTPEDASNYHAAAAKLATQLNSYCPFKDACVNGKQVLTESIADLTGLLVAHDAYILSLNGKPDSVIGGLTGEQRFFVAFSQRWRRLQSETAARAQIKADNHPPGEYRSDTVRNVDDWYRAFGVTRDDKLYLKPEDRVKIW